MHAKLKLSGALSGQNIDRGEHRDGASRMPVALHSAWCNPANPAAITVILKANRTRVCAHTNMRWQSRASILNLVVGAVQFVLPAASASFDLQVIWHRMDVPAPSPPLSSHATLTSSDPSFSNRVSDIGEWCQSYCPAICVHSCLKNERSDVCFVFSLFLYYA